MRRILPFLLTCAVLGTSLSQAVAQERLRIDRGSTDSWESSIDPVEARPGMPARRVAPPVQPQESFADQFRQPPPDSFNVPELQVGTPSRTAIRLPERPVANTTPTFSARLSGQDAATLGSRDVILLIDKSGSMSETDCPGMPQSFLDAFVGISRGRFLSRWDWCKQQAMVLAQQTRGILPNGLTLVPFDGRFRVYPQASSADIPRIFLENSPQGSTDLTAALRSQLEQFQRRKASGQQIRPLVIAVISDGLPNNTRTLRNVIKEYTQRIGRPDQVKITFLQIGQDATGRRLLRDLDDTLVDEGAVFDIVDSKPFEQVVQLGLARALIDAIRE